MRSLVAGGIAGGLTGVVVSFVCAVLVSAFPAGFANSYGALVFHGIDISGLIVKPQFTVVKLLLGFVYAFITGFVIGGAFAFFYNWSTNLVK